MYIYNIIVVQLILVVSSEKEKRVILLLFPLCKAHLVWLSQAVNKRSALQPLFFLSSLELP